MAALPSLLRDLARQWDLTTDGGLLGRGYNAVVLPVRQSGRPLALKLTWPPGQARKEADALGAWRARGAVELAACDGPRGTAAGTVPAGQLAEGGATGAVRLAAGSTRRCRRSLVHDALSSRQGRTAGATSGPATCAGPGDVRVAATAPAVADCGRSQKLLEKFGSDPIS